MRFSLSIISILKSASRSVLRAIFLPFRRLGIPLPERLFRHLHLRGKFDLNLPGGRKLVLMSWGDCVENELFWRGWDGHEPDAMKRWVSLAQCGGTILDIGANTGTYAFIAKAISPASRVFAFEPVNRIAARIEENCSVSGLDVVVVRAAVADLNGELPIYDPGGENAYSASLDPEFLDCEKESHLVPVVTLNSFCSENDLTPSLIKLDVEGIEGLALLGASDILIRGECCFICEWLGKSQAHAKAVSLLNESGYVAADLTTLEPIDLGNPRSHGERNILLVPQARWEVLKRSPNPDD